MTCLPFYRVSIRPIGAGYAPCFERLIVNDAGQRSWTFAKLAGRIYRDSGSARRRAESIGSEQGFRVV
jgi:hypothetical protein